MTRLTGSDLLTKVSELQAQNASRTDIVLACGYVRDNGKAAYTAFYEELIAAKQPEWNNQEAEDVDTDLEFADEEHQEQFMELCANYPQEALEIYYRDFENFNDFEEAYVGEYNSEAHFTEELISEFGDYQIPSWIAIDYQTTWDTALRYDYWEEDGYFFRNI